VPRPLHRGTHGRKGRTRCKARGATSAPGGGLSAHPTSTGPRRPTPAPVRQRRAHGGARRTWIAPSAVGRHVRLKGRPEREPSSNGPNGSRPLSDRCPQPPGAAGPESQAPQPRVPGTVPPRLRREPFPRGRWRERPGRRPWIADRCRARASRPPGPPGPGRPTSPAPESRPGSGPAG